MRSAYVQFLHLLASLFISPLIRCFLFWNYFVYCYLSIIVIHVFNCYFVLFLFHSPQINGTRDKTSSKHVMFSSWLETSTGWDENFCCYSNIIIIIIIIYYFIYYIFYILYYFNINIIIVIIIIIIYC